MIALNLALSISFLCRTETSLPIRGISYLLIYYPPAYNWICNVTLFMCLSFLPAHFLQCSTMELATQNNY